MFTTRALNPQTWPAYADLIDRNRGIWGGCWCMAFHPEGIGKHKTPAQNRAEKQARVWAGTAQAALVFDAEICLGWAQFGAVEDLPRIKNRKEYDKGRGTDALPDWRITCFYVEPAARGRGIADAALSGALDLIGLLGGGIVEGYPDAVDARTSASFLFHGTTGSFERLGFDRIRPIGKSRWVMRRTLDAVARRPEV